MSINRILLRSPKLLRGATYSRSLPEGYAFVTDADGKFLTDGSGLLLIVQV